MIKHTSIRHKNQLKIIVYNYDQKSFWIVYQASAYYRQKSNTAHGFVCAAKGYQVRYAFLFGFAGWTKMAHREDLNHEYPN